MSTDVQDPESTEDSSPVIDDSTLVASAPPPPSKAAQNSNSPSVPPKWSDITSSPDYDKLTPEQKNDKLNQWSSQLYGYLKSRPDFNSEAYQKFSKIVDEKRQDLGPTKLQQVQQLAEQLSPSSSQLLMGPAAMIQNIPVVRDIEGSIAGGVAGGVKIASEIGQDDQPFSEALGINARLGWENAMARLAGQKDNLDKALDNIKTSVDSGSLDPDTLKQNTDAILQAKNKQYGVPVGTLQGIDEQNPASSKMMGILQQYAVTRDPGLWNEYKRWATSNPHDAAANAEIDRQIGSVVDIGHSVDNFTGSPALAAWVGNTVRNSMTSPLNVATAPLMGLGGETQSVASQIFGKTFASPAGMGALGAATEYFGNPNASAGDVAKAGLEQAAIPLVTHAAIHAVDMATRLTDLQSKKADLENNPSPLAPESSKALAADYQKKIDELTSQLALPAPTIQDGEKGFVLNGDGGDQVIRDEPQSPINGQNGIPVTPETDDERVQKFNDVFPPAKQLALPEPTTQPGEKGFVIQSTSNKNVIRDEAAAPNVSPMAPETTSKSVPEGETSTPSKNTVRPSANEQIQNAGGTSEGQISLDPLQDSKDEAAKGLWDIGVHRDISSSLGEELENAKTPEEVAAVKSKIDNTPKDQLNGYSDLDNLTKTVVDEARKGNDVSEFPLENQRQAADFLNKNNEPEAAKASGYNAASGKEISFRQLSPDFASESSEAESNLNPEQKASVQSKLEDSESAFGPEAADRLRAALKNPDDADQIMAAAREKYRRQLLNNPESEAISPITVRDSIVRDYFDKVKAREDIQKSSLNEEVGQEGSTTRGEITPAPKTESTASPEEIQNIAQNAISKADLTDNEKEIVGRGAMDDSEAADYAKAKGQSVTQPMKDLVSAATKLKDALQPDIDSGKITSQDAVDTIHNILKDGYQEPPQPTGTQAPPIPSQPLKPTSIKDLTPEEGGADRQQWIQKLNTLSPDSKNILLQAMPRLRNAGIYADRLHILKDGKIDGNPKESYGLANHDTMSFGPNGTTLWVRADMNGDSHFFVNEDRIQADMAAHAAAGQAGYFNQWLQQTEMGHEFYHIAHNNFIQKWGVENGYTDFASAQRDFAGALKGELQSLQIGKSNAWHIGSNIYGKKGFTDTQLTMEVARMVNELHVDKELSEQVTKPQFPLLSKFLDFMNQWLPRIAGHPYINSLIQNTDRLLGRSPVTDLPFTDPALHPSIKLRDNSLALAAQPPPIPRSPEVNPMGKLSEDISKLPEVMGEDSLGQKITKASEMAQGDSSFEKIGNGIMAGVKTVRNTMAEAPKYGNSERAIGETDWAIGDNVRKATQFSEDIKNRYSDDGKKGISYYNIFGKDEDQIRGALARMDENNPNREGLEAALRLTPQDKAIADHVNDFYNAWGDTLVQKGAIEGMITDYAQNMKWVKNPDEVTQLMGEVASGKWRTDSNYFKKRILNPQEEIIKGRQLGNSDIAEAVKDYNTSATRALFTRQAIGKLLGTVEEDGRNTVQPYSARSDTDLSGYKIVQHPAMRGYKIPAIDAAGTPYVEDGPLAVHPEAFDKVNNWLNSVSPIQKNAIGKALLSVNSGIKEIRYASPLYHTMTEGLHASIHGVNPFKIKPIDYNNGWEIEKMQHGLMTQPQSFDWNTSEGVGAYKGNVFPAIEKYGAKVPVIGQAAGFAANKIAGLQRWLFEKYIPNLMSQAFDKIYDRNAKWYPEVNHDDLMYLTAKQVNSGFVGPNTNMLGRSPIVRDSMRLAIGAPAFNEGRLRFLGGAATKYGGENRRALGILGLASYVAARAFNQWYNGDSYASKPFSFIANGKEIKFRHVLGDALEMASSAIPMMSKFAPKGTFSSVAQAAPFLNDQSGSANYIKNRMSPAAHLVADPALGLTDYRGQPIGVKDSLLNFASGISPLGVSQAVEGALPKSIRPTGYSPRSWEDDLMQGIGLNSKDYGAYQAMYEKGANFAAAQGKPRQSGTPSDYADLKWELRHDDDYGAQKELESLLQNHSYGQITKSIKSSVKAPFTGNSELEPDFVKSLSPYEKNLYQEAVTERRNTFIKLQQLGNKLNLNKGDGYHALPKSERQSIINQELQTP